MPTVSCLHCGMKQVIPTDMLGEDVDCPHCEMDFRAELDDEPPRRRARIRTLTRRRRGLDPAKLILGVGAVGIGVGGLLGLFLSQFAPCFGGFIGQLGRPFSPARLELIPVHVIAFGLLGGVLAAAVAALVRFVPRD